MNWWYLYCEKCQWCGELNTAYQLARDIYWDMLGDPT